MMSNPLQRFLNLPMVSRVRRNHSLEHATLNVLSEHFPNTTLIGRSDGRGFYIYGQVPTEAVKQSVAEALDRLRDGEHSLAIHPNCGTNLVTSGILAGASSFLCLARSKDEGWRERLERLPLVIAVTTLALIVAQPLGRSAQKYITTEPIPGPLEVLSIHLLSRGQAKVHRVLTVS
jgi:hypothetical protein